MSGSDGRGGYLVECYWPGVSERKLAAAMERAQAAVADVCRAGRPVDLVGSILVPADETVFCLFDGSEDDVRAASAQAGGSVRARARVATHPRQTSKGGGAMSNLFANEVNLCNAGRGGGNSNP
jgi:hypothetical protein